MAKIGTTLAYLTANFGCKYEQMFAFCLKKWQFRVENGEKV